MDGLKWHENVFVSKNLEIAGQTHELFEQLWQTMDDFGQVFAWDEWKDVTRKIGTILGYPKTAVDDFVNLKNNRDAISYESRLKRMERNRYYAHSAEYEEQEYREYDYKLNKAISELAPKTTDILANNQAKRWLE